MYRMAQAPLDLTSPSQTCLKPDFLVSVMWYLKVTTQALYHSTPCKTTRGLNPEYCLIWSTLSWRGAEFATPNMPLWHKDYFNPIIFKKQQGTSLVVQWLRLYTSKAGGTGLIPGWGTKIPYAMWHGQKIKRNSRRRRSSENQVEADLL